MSYTLSTREYGIFLWNPIRELNSKYFVSIKEYKSSSSKILIHQILELELELSAYAVIY